VIEPPEGFGGDEISALGRIDRILFGKGKQGRIDIFWGEGS
jgi:hypothetical protein